MRKKAIETAFESFEWLSCRFGRGAFLLDSRCTERPAISGSVVASLSFSRARKAILQVYPIEETMFSAAAMKEFEQKVVPELVGWLKGQLGKPETALLGHEQKIVSWDGMKFGFAQVRF